MPQTAPGNRRLVALLAPAGPAFVDEVTRCWDAGDAVAPLDPRLPAAQTRRLLDLLRPAVLRTTDGEESLADAAPVDEGVAAVLTTSGSQGRPKAVELTATALAASADATAARLGLSPPQRWLCCLPVAHIAGFQIITRSLRAGTTPVVLPRFDPRAVAQVAAAGSAQVVSLVPTMLSRLLDVGVDLSGFAHVLVGGAALPAALRGRAEEAGAAIIETYGMTETCGGCVYDGRPLDGVEVAVDDDGRVLLRGPVLLRGYRGEAAAPVSADGWFRTGDIGRLTPHGLEVLGRGDELVVTGGNNVAPDAVAGALATLPSVAAAAVVPRPDPDLGHALVAVVVPADPARPPTLEAVRAGLAAALPPYALPRDLVLREALPLLPSGKVDHNRLIGEVTAPRPPPG